MRHRSSCLLWDTRGLVAGLPRQKSSKVHWWGDLLMGPYPNCATEYKQSTGYGKDETIFFYTWYIEYLMWSWVFFFLFLFNLQICILLVLILLVCSFSVNGLLMYNDIIWRCSTTENPTPFQIHGGLLGKERNACTETIEVASTGAKCTPFLCCSFQWVQLPPAVVMMQ